MNHVFKKDSGGLKVIPSPEEAEVLIDRYPLGSGEQTVEAVEPGVHKLRLTAPQHLDYYEDVLVKTGKTSTVRANLTPTSGAVTDRPGIKTGDGKKKAPIIIAIVGAVTAGTVIAIAAANTEGPEPDLPPTDFVFQLP